MKYNYNEILKTSYILDAYSYWKGLPEYLIAKADVYWFPSTNFLGEKQYEFNDKDVIFKTGKEPYETLLAGKHKKYAALDSNFLEEDFMDVIKPFDTLKEAVDYLFRDKKKLLREVFLRERDFDDSFIKFLREYK